MNAICVICGQHLEWCSERTMQPYCGGEVRFIFSYGSTKFDKHMYGTVFNGVICDDCAERCMHNMREVKHDQQQNTRIMVVTYSGRCSKCANKLQCVETYPDPDRYVCRFECKSKLCPRCGEDTALTSIFVQQLNPAASPSAPG